LWGAHGKKIPACRLFATRTKRSSRQKLKGHVGAAGGPKPKANAGAQKKKKKKKKKRAGASCAAEVAAEMWKASGLNSFPLFLRILFLF
jgi:hypothetical protein